MTENNVSEKLFNLERQDIALICAFLGLEGQVPLSMPIHIAIPNLPINQLPKIKAPPNGRAL